MRLNGLMLAALILGSAVLTTPSVSAHDEDEFGVPIPVTGIETALRFKASLRYHGEYFNDPTDEPGYSFHDMRGRLTLNLLPERNEQGILELQSLHLLGGSYGDGGPYYYNEGAPVVFSQVNISIDNCLGDNMGGRLGRLRYQFGNERLIGDDSWYFGRGFDGGAFYFGDKRIFRNLREVDNPTEPSWLEMLPRTVTARYPEYNTGIGAELLLFKIAERDIVDDDDVDFMGLNLHLPSIGLVPFGYYLRDNTDVDGRRREYLYTIGTYGQFNLDNNVLIQGNFGYQLGSFRSPGFPDVVEQDIRAYLIQADAFFYMGGYERPLALGAGIDFTSGDDGEDADKIKTWNNLAYSPHQFRGRLDLFADQPWYGINDFIGRVGFFPSRKISTGLDIHLLRSNVDFPSAVDIDQDSKSIGAEFDIFFRYNAYQHTHWTFELNYFKPSEDFAGQDAEGVFGANARATFAI